MIDSLSVLASLIVLVIAVRKMIVMEKKAPDKTQERHFL